MFRMYREINSTSQYYYVRRDASQGLDSWRNATLEECWSIGFMILLHGEFYEEASDCYHLEGRKKMERIISLILQ